MNTLDHIKRTTMKTRLTLTVLVLLFTIQAHAQFSFGIKGGAAPVVAPNTNYTIANRAVPVDEFTFNISDIKNGFYAGAFSQYDLDASFFLRAEALYNWYEIDYLINYTFESRFRSSDEVTYTEKVHRVDLPLSLGARIGAFEVVSGLVPRFILKNENEMASMEGYSEEMKTLQLGFHSGVGINIQHVKIGMSYQMDFQNYGAHIRFRGESLDLQNRPSRIIFTLGYEF